MNKAELGQAIATERKAQGITIRKMAEMAETSTRAVQAVEKGLYNVGIDTYLKIAQMLNLSLKVGEWPTTPAKEIRPSQANCGGLFRVLLNAEGIDSSYKHCKGSENSPYKQKMCVEIAYLSLELPNKSAKTFLFAD